ncbi:MAG: alcohol dehydrogenase catalytic domain-containing protein [Candidatus Manganitrophus sp.]|nr:alcohol dehydrogenase catalytic domain-containing protein [Candidatus Manganitrophus sp.]
MKAVVFHGVGDIRYEEVSDPRIEKPNDAVVRIIASAICGTDLHMIRGTLPGMKPGTILGHEGVGIIEELCQNFGPHCFIAAVWDTAQCDHANPNGPLAGTTFFAPRAYRPQCPSSPFLLLPMNWNDIILWTAAWRPDPP